MASQLRDGRKAKLVYIAEKRTQCIIDERLLREPFGAGPDSALGSTTWALYLNWTILSAHNGRQWKQIMRPRRAAHPHQTRAAVHAVRAQRRRVGQDAEVAVMNCDVFLFLFLL